MRGTIRLIGTSLAGLAGLISERCRHLTLSLRRGCVRACALPGIDETAFCVRSHLATAAGLEQRTHGTVRDNVTAYGDWVCVPEQTVRWHWVVGRRRTKPQEQMLRVTRLPEHAARTSLGGYSRRFKTRT